MDQSRSVAYNRNTVVTMSGEDHPRAFVLDECQEVGIIEIVSGRASPSFKKDEFYLFCLKAIVINKRDMFYIT